MDWAGGCTVIMMTLERISRSDLLRRPEKYHLRRARKASQGRVRRIVVRYGMAERLPSRMMWPMACRGMVRRREKLAAAARVELRSQCLQCYWDGVGFHWRALCLVIE